MEFVFKNTKTKTKIIRNSKTPNIQQMWKPSLHIQQLLQKHIKVKTTIILAFPGSFQKPCFGLICNDSLKNLKKPEPPPPQDQMDGNAKDLLDVVKREKVLPPPL